VVTLACAALAPGSAAAADPSGCTLHVVAHQDDDLLFHSPALLQEVRSDGCVRTVFLTAGDAGREKDYWSARERGAQSAYAEMAGTADEWITRERTFAGRTVVERQLVGRPDVSLVFLRLPDGFYAGGGSERYGFKSLRRLWQGVDAGGPVIVTPVDGTPATYDRQGLLDVLRAVMDDVRPRVIATQDWTEPFGDGDQADHADHVATALFTREAASTYATPHVVRAYQDYSSGGRPVNLSGGLLRAKQSAFYAYALHDFLCRDDVTCDADPEYGAWLKRQYVMDTRTVGVVADAGEAQEATAGSTVRLDGSASATASGAPPTFRWVQTGGPTVALRNPTSATPSFEVPAKPADPAARVPLTFALEVADGQIAGVPDTVTVGPPRPLADAGRAQTVPSGATVTLDGRASSDPDPKGAALVHEWTQLTGSPVVLQKATTSRPTFTAPAGPASLRFSLVVRSGTRRSYPVPVTVSVAPPSSATRNVAVEATATASSEAPNQGAANAIDGVIGGVEPPDWDGGNEWSSAGEGAGARLTLAWRRAVTLDHVELFDRPNGVDRITSGTLRFADGSEVAFGALPPARRSPLSDFFALPDDARRGLTVTFPPRSTRSLRITVRTVASGTLNIGLAEVRAWGT
jgi:LmbE family N-acetylglucosaminyl deacetylase